MEPKAGSFRPNTVFPVSKKICKYKEAVAKTNFATASFFLLDRSPLLQRSKLIGQGVHHPAAELAQTFARYESAAAAVTEFPVGKP